MTAAIFQLPFRFIKGAVTSRGIIDSKLHFFLLLKNEEGYFGMGECAPIAGLTPEPESEIIAELLSAARLWESNEFSIDRIQCSAVRVAFEMALGGLALGSPGVFFKHSDHFIIQVNGLVWMNETSQMLLDARNLRDRGFHCVKLKVDGKNPGHCMEVLQQLRSQYSSRELRIRLDANGSFATHRALSLLNELAVFEIEFIEQPIAKGNWKFLSEICRDSPIRIALDEELIGLGDADERDDLLKYIHPAALVLKPSLHGGFSSCEDWIERCSLHGVDWWCTSYLESNLGLAALAQWLSNRDNGQTHGLGTGKLYDFNFDIPASVEAGVFEWQGSFCPAIESIPGMVKVC
jgi:L-alanine-DL-glutamate epimerase-like enolase superfamily enzyme